MIEANNFLFANAQMDGNSSLKLMNKKTYICKTESLFCALTNVDSKPAIFQ